VTLAFTAGVSVLAVAFFGVVPAFRSTDMDCASRLKGNVSSWSIAGNQRWSRGLIVLQVALLMVLILSSGLFLGTLHNLTSVDLGFDPSNVLLIVVDPFGSGHSSEQLKTLTADLLERIDALPGVRAASLVRFAPISGGTGVNLTFVINRQFSGRMVARSVWVNTVGPQYFTTLGVPLIAGREFNAADNGSPRPVVIVNQAFARRYFGQDTPVGKTITQSGTPMEIVGVVGDAKYSDVREVIPPTVYINAFQEFGSPMQFVIRTEREPQLLSASVRSEVRSVMGSVAIRERVLRDHIDATITRERLVARLAVFFGGLALVLAVIGLYGVVSSSVASRTRDIGIRIALGFDRRDAVMMVMREVFVLVGGGIVLGLPVAVFVTRSISTMFFGLPPDDPVTVIASVAALIGSAFAAGFIPARRASRIDPIVALRID
jgi:predicted permease